LKLNVDEEIDARTNPQNESGSGAPKFEVELESQNPWSNWWWTDGQFSRV